MTSRGAGRGVSHSNSRARHISNHQLITGTPCLESSFHISNSHIKIVHALLKTFNCILLHLLCGIKPSDVLSNKLQNALSICRTERNLMQHYTKRSSQKGLLQPQQPSQYSPAESKHLLHKAYQHNNEPHPPHDSDKRPLNHHPPKAA